MNTSTITKDELNNYKIVSPERIRKNSRKDNLYVNRQGQLYIKKEYLNHILTKEHKVYVYINNRDNTILLSGNAIIRNKGYALPLVMASNSKGAFTVSFTSIMGLLNLKSPKKFKAEKLQLEDSHITFVKLSSK
jgi:hypothetical protein